jgi:thiamine-monophosphate kinase
MFFVWLLTLINERDLVRVKEIGERALIELMLRHIKKMPEMPLPFWDDAMAIQLNNGIVMVLNTDMLVWETDVPDGMTPFQAGRKAVVMNISDLGAKGVRPRAFLASLGIPGDTSVELVEELVKGFEAGVREYEAYFIGGDTNEASEIIISGVALGTAPNEILIKRDGAQPGDILATTGSFGDTAASFKILLHGLQAPEVLKNALLESVYSPRARINEGVALAESRTVTASIDSSDGLALSLYDLSKSSKVGFTLEHLPISKNAEKFGELNGLDLEELSLYGGEEYELIFTVNPKRIEEAKIALRSVGCQLIEIGKVTKEKRIILCLDDATRAVRKRGWDHFIMGA